MDGRTAWAGGNRKRGQEAPATTLAEVSPMVDTLCGNDSHSRDICPGLPHARWAAPPPPFAPSLRNPAPRKIKARGTPLHRARGGLGRLLYFPAAFTDIFPRIFGNIKPCNSNNYKEGRFKKWLLFP